MQMKLKVKLEALSAPIPPIAQNWVADRIISAIKQVKKDEILNIPIPDVRNGLSIPTFVSSVMIIV